MFRVLLPPLLALGLAVEGAAQRTVVPAEVKRDRLSPMLDLLPAGSTIKEVRIPRFDAEKRRAALLRAALLEIVSEDQISGAHLELRLFSKEGPESLRMQMDSADFSRTTGILEAHDSIVVSGEKIEAQGQGGLFHLDSRQGFVRGPVATTFIRPENGDEKKETPDKNDPEGVDTLGTVHEEDLATPDRMLEIGPAEFTEPNPLTPAERREMELLVRSRSKSLSADRAPARAFMIKAQQLSQAAEVSYRSFVNRVGSKRLLSGYRSNGPARKPAFPEDKTGEILVTCEGGMYLDPEHGHLSYLRNIEIQEERFTMTCSDHLRVFFEPLEDNDEAGSDTGEAERNNPRTQSAPPSLGLDTEFSNPGDFATLKFIVASGAVRITRRGETKDEPTVIATASTAIVNVETGDMLLQGGYPSVAQGPNSLRAGEADLYLRYDADGDIIAEGGRWTTVGDLGSLQANDERADPSEARLAPEGGSTQPTPKTAEETEPASTNANKDQEQTVKTTTVTCTGGIYFDARKGQVVYLGDIEVSDPRFRMQAEDELKILLGRDPDAPDNSSTGLEAFSEVKHVVASGKVAVTRNDPGGKRPPVVAKADHVIMDVETTSLFLQGGGPAITQGANSLTANAPDLYLRFYENGSLFAEQGAWTTIGDLANLRGAKDVDKKPANTIKVTCTGGLYFDSLKGHVVYTGKVVVLESRFAMNCESMRIHLQKRENANRDRLEGPEAFSDVDVIVATGGVTVARRDPNGKAPITASAETATYEAKSGNIVLRGGFPVIRRGKSYLKALEPGLYILFKASGSFETNTGNWDTVGNADDLEELRNLKERGD